MSRYVDADKIDWRLIIPTNVTIAEENMIHNAKKLVERQPTADVKPVVYGKWIQFSLPLDDGSFGGYECSQCKKRMIFPKHPTESEYRFCPNCGAKMDKGGDAK